MGSWTIESILFGQVAYTIEIHRQYCMLAIWIYQEVVSQWNGMTYTDWAATHWATLTINEQGSKLHIQTLICELLQIPSLPHSSFNLQSTDMFSHTLTMYGLCSCTLHISERSFIQSNTISRYIFQTCRWCGSCELWHTYVTSLNWWAIIHATYSYTDWRWCITESRDQIDTNKISKIQQK